MNRRIAWPVCALFFAAGLAHAAPDERYDRVLSPARPLGAAETRQARTAATPFGKPTFTYLRCFYRPGAGANTAGTAYLWAWNPAHNGYFHLPGVWRSGSKLPWQAMFYSTQSQNTLNEVCRLTLALAGIGGQPAWVAAANNALSYNHAVWTLSTDGQGDGLERMVVFGDSLSDIQNMYSISQWKLPHAPTWYLGRFSNGPVWVEALSAALKLPLYDWAIGGAAAKREWALPGVLEQETSWEAYARADPGYRPDRTLFTLWVGGNDLISYRRSPKDVAADLQAVLERLIARGARHVLLLNLPDLGQVPAAQRYGDSRRLSAKTDAFNTRLAALVNRLRQANPALRLALFDTHALFDDVIAHPENYQIDDVSDSCLQIPAGQRPPWIYLAQLAPSSGCASADRYLFWDLLHPSAHTHALLARQIAAFLQSAAGMTLPTATREDRP